MTNKSRKETLRSDIAILRDELWEIENAEKCKANQSLVGKCFKYSNSYGGGKPSDRWWLYIMVT